MTKDAVGNLGEFRLIARLKDAIAAPADERLVVGIGDDAAVWRADGAYTIATTDTMVEGVHFDRDAVDARDVGWKALAVNLSDVAAMGGAPSFALVTLCLPPATPTAWVDALYAGLRECAGEYGVTVAGGDIVASPVLTITVALAGSPEAGSDGAPLLLRRDAARPGDLIAVTGPLGGSAGGLRVLRDHPAPTGETLALVQRHVRPRPRLDAGCGAVRAGVRCAIDISDGLVQDVGHISEASGCGATLRLPAVPVDPALLAAYPDDAPLLAATGGEDYELVLVAPAAVLDRVSASLDAPLAIVGEITADAARRVRLVDAAGAEVPLAERGWDHLRARPA